MLKFLNKSGKSPEIIIESDNGISLDVQRRQIQWKLYQARKN